MSIDTACAAVEVDLPQESGGGAEMEAHSPAAAAQDHASAAHAANAPRESHGLFSVPETHHDVLEVETADKEGVFLLNYLHRGLFFSVSC